MRESIGSVFLYNIIIVFVFLVFAFLAAIMSYSKAFKVNSRIVATIEKFEGYNQLAKDEVAVFLSGMGYRFDDDYKCTNSKTGQTPIENGFPYHVCVYGPERAGNNHYRYEVVSYMHFDFTAVGVVFSIPVYTKTNSMYDYSCALMGVCRV